MRKAARMLIHCYYTIYFVLFKAARTTSFLQYAASTSPHFHQYTF